MTYFLTIFTICFFAILLTDVLNLFFKRNEKLLGYKKEWGHLLLEYKWISIIAVICAFITLYNNHIFLDFFGIYNVEASPCGTLYCHVEVKTSNGTTIYPCEIWKTKDQDGTYYLLQTIYMGKKTVDVSEQDIQVFTDHYAKHDKIEYKIVNIKYEKYEDIYEDKASYFFEIADLFLGLSCAYIPYKTFKIYVSGSSD